MVKTLDIGYEKRIPSIKRIILAGIILLGALVGFGVSKTAVLSPSDAGNSEPERAGWKYLSYRGSHFLGDVKTEVTLAELPLGEACKQLISIPQGNPLAASSTPVRVIDVQSEVDPLFGAGELSGSRGWFSSDNAVALQRIRFRRGDDIWQNTYRFAQNGVYRIRKKPGRADEKKMEPAHWTKIKESFFAYQPTGSESKIVMEPTELLYLAANFDLRSTTGSRILYVFDRKQLHEVTVEVDEPRRLKVSYTEKGPQKKIQRDGMIDVVKITFKPRALAPQGELPEQFSFMRLKGDFEIYIDSATRVPVQISGRVKGIGKLQIRLQKVGF